LKLVDSENHYLVFTFDSNLKGNENNIYEKISTVTSNSKEFFSSAAGSGKRLNVCPIVDLGVVGETYVEVGICSCELLTLVIFFYVYFFYEYCVVTVNRIR
jgi:hypothetical protein